MFAAVLSIFLGLVTVGRSKNFAWFALKPPVNVLIIIVKLVNMVVATSDNKRTGKAGCGKRFVVHIFVISF